MIVVALGSNRDGPWGNPERTVSAALRQLDSWPLRLVAASRLIRTAPFGNVGQPPFVNAVAIVETHLPPVALMRHLHAIERKAGRRRMRRWGPRTLDLDLIDCRGLIRHGGGGNALRLPHPGVAEREFVLKPIAEVAPRWRHPLLRLTAAELLRRLRIRKAGREI